MRTAVNPRITCRHRDEIVEVDRDRVDYIDISPRMMVSIATAMIPFLENDDANRALMGANMQRQAVPLMVTEAPIVATGIEHKLCVDSGVVILAEDDGLVMAVSADSVKVRYDSGEIKDYKLIKFARSNQGTCINQRPIVAVGDRLSEGDVIADGPATSQGEIALGKNLLVGFMTWEGYNYEDAVLINERLVMEDVYTSIHIEEFECDARDTKLGPEEITRDIPGVGDDALKYLDDRGIICVGAEVRSGDILVGKVTPKGETDLTAEERLLRAIFGEKAREVRDTSLKVPHGESGIVVDAKVFTRENGDELSPGVNEVVRVYIAQRRKIQVGDKMAGRHGNKGVVSCILPEEDMPFFADGRPVDIVLNPLGVPSRMNIGQIMETHLGWGAKELGRQLAELLDSGAALQVVRDEVKDVFDSPAISELVDKMDDEEFIASVKKLRNGIVTKTPVFDGATEEEIWGWMEKAGKDGDGKTVSVGSYMIPLLEENCEKAGVQILLNTTANEILTDANGAAVGVKATGASGENMRLVQAGDVDFAMVQNDVADSAFNGLAPFRSKLDNVRVIGRLYPEYLHVVASKDSGVKALEDFKGKKVSVGARQRQRSELPPDLRLLRPGLQEHRAHLPALR
mgnify:CR=1 FL=1